MMAPTFVTSFFGMNFKLPFDDLPGYIPVLIATVICLVSVFLCSWMLNWNKETVGAIKKAKQMNRKQKQKLKAETKKIKKQEKRLS